MIYILRLEELLNDENDILMKLDKDTYIIDYVVPIPEISM